MNQTTNNRGFTLVEILVVMALIVLLLILAVPAFNVMTGSRSVEGAQNMVGALLGRARAEAVGTEKKRGVLFVQDVASGRTLMTLVHEVSANGNPPPGADPNVDLWLDVDASPELVEMPTGVGVQTIDNGGVITAGTSADDRFIGYNSVNGNDSTQYPMSYRYGGVILFDGSGKVFNHTYGFQVYTMKTGTALFSNVGALLYGKQTSDLSGAYKDLIPIVNANPKKYVRSQMGVALFDASAFGSRNYTPADSEVDSSILPFDEIQKTDSEENWLDSNATLLLINRFNGTLIRAQ